MGEKKLERFLTVEEVSDLLRMPKSTIYQKVSEGLIKTYKPGKKILFDPEDVRNFMKRFMQK